MSSLRGLKLDVFDSSKVGVKGLKRFGMTMAVQPDKAYFGVNRFLTPQIKISHWHRSFQYIVNIFVFENITLLK